MKLNDSCIDHCSIPIVGEPHVYNVNQHRHDGVKEETYICPPSSPYNKFSGDNSIQASKTHQTQSPNICILSTSTSLWNQDMICLENVDGNIVNY